MQNTNQPKQREKKSIHFPFFFFHLGFLKSEKQIPWLPQSPLGSVCTPVSENPQEQKSDFSKSVFFFFFLSNPFLPFRRPSWKFWDFFIVWCVPILRLDLFWFSCLRFLSLFFFLVGDSVLNYFMMFPILACFVGDPVENLRFFFYCLMRTHLKIGSLMIWLFEISFFFLVGDSVLNYLMMFTFKHLWFGFQSFYSLYLYICFYFYFIFNMYPAKLFSISSVHIFITTVSIRTFQTSPNFSWFI